jgi:hypothetical protein
MKGQENMWEVEVGLHECLTLVLDKEAIFNSGRYVTEEKAPTLLVFQSLCESCIKIIHLPPDKYRTLNCRSSGLQQ